MRFHLTKQLQGVSLLELLFVLAIAAAIIMAGIGRYQQQRRGAEIDGIKNNVQVIFAAFSKNYRKYCTDNTDTPQNSYTTDDYLNPKDPNKNVIKQVNDVMLRTPLVTDYTIKANYLNKQEGTDKPIFNLNVIVTLDKEQIDASQMDWYARRLGATKTGANQLTWTHMPNYDLVTLNTGAWGSTMGLRYYKKYMLQHTTQQPIADTSCAY